MMKSVPRRLRTIIKRHGCQRLICSFFWPTIVLLLGFFHCCLVLPKRDISLNTWLRLHIVRFHRFPMKVCSFHFQRGCHIVHGGKFPVSGSNKSQIHHIFESILSYGSQRRSRLSVRRCFFRCLFIDMSIVHGSCQSLTLSCILLYFYTHSYTHTDSPHQPAFHLSSASSS